RTRAQPGPTSGQQDFRAAPLPAREPWGFNLICEEAALALEKGALPLWRTHQARQGSLLFGGAPGNEAVLIPPAVGGAILQVLVGGFGPFAQVVSLRDQEWHAVHDLDGLQRPGIIVGAPKEQRASDLRPPELPGILPCEEHAAEHDHPVAAFLAS